MLKSAARKYSTLAAAVALLMLAACGPAATPTPANTPTPRPTSTPRPTATATPGGPKPTPTPTATPDPTAAQARTILTAATDVFVKAQSYHFTLDMNLQLPYNGKDLTVPTKLSGDFKAPDGTRGTLTTTAFGQSFDKLVVRVADKTYVTDSSGRWAESSSAEVVPAEASELVAGFGAAHDLVLVGTETYGSAPVYRIRAIVPVKTAEGAATDFAMELLVDTRNNQLLRATGSGAVALSSTSNPLTPTGAPTGVVITSKTTVDLALLDFNKAVTIEAPVVGSTPKP